MYKKIAFFFLLLSVTALHSSEKTKYSKLSDNENESSASPMPPTWSIKQLYESYSPSSRPIVPSSPQSPKKEVTTVEVPTIFVHPRITVELPYAARAWLAELAEQSRKRRAQFIGSK